MQTLLMFCICRVFRLQDAGHLYLIQLHSLLYVCAFESKAYFFKHVFFKGVLYVAY